MSKSSSDNAYDAEMISLVDVVNFLVVWWKLILLAGFGAALAGWFYAKSIAPLYQAQTIIAMAEIPVLVSDKKFGLSPIETPSVLAERMSLPSAFSMPTVEACEFDSANELYRHFKIVSHSDAHETMRIAIQHKNADVAAKCTGAIFEMIKGQQAKMVKPLFMRNSDLIAKSRHLFEIYHKDKNSRVGFNETRMLTPIYAEAEPISPLKKRIVLSWGVAGLFCGLLISMMWTLILWFRRKI